MSYTKQTWQTGNTITAEKLNHIEDGIDDVNRHLSDVEENQIPELNDAISQIGTRTNDDLEDADLAFVDEDDNAILELVEGHVVTKNFNSKFAVQNDIDDTYVEYLGEPIRVKRNYVKAEFVTTLSLQSTDIPQGGACFGKYYFQMFYTRSGCAIVDLETLQIVQTYRFDTSSAAWHCNNANFSSVFYDASDPFPLLYISQENNQTRCVHVYRITGEVGTLTFTLVQTITWDDPAVSSVYYANACIDLYQNYLIQIGYKANSYSDPTNNAIKINVFSLPLVSAGDITLLDSSKIDGFEVAFTPNTQGSIAINGKIYEVFGSGNTDRSVRVFDMDEKRLVTTISLLPSEISSIVSGEQEALFVYSGELHLTSRTATITKLVFKEA